MLSFEERELARQFHELGASIEVPATPRRATASIVPLVAAIAALLLVVVLIVVVRSEDSFNTASPPSPSHRPSSSASPSPSAGVIASPTPSHRATPYAGLPPQILPTPGPTYTITGTITQLGPDGQQHPVNGARVDVWVGLQNGAGYHWMTDLTDTDGRYELWGIPRGATATLYASTSGTSLQPCAHQIAMFADESADIEVVTSGVAADAIAAEQRGVRLRPNAMIFGWVLEKRGDGTTVGVANAKVWVGGDMEPLTATTMTDANGLYIVCGLTELRHEFTATAPGFSGSKAFPTADANGLEVDFEMSR